MNKSYLLRVMRLLILLLFVGLMHANAAINAQTITLKGKDLSLEIVLQVIRQQTGYTIFTAEHVLRDAKPVTIDVRDMPVDAFLKAILVDQPLAVTIENNTIIIKKKARQRQNLSAAMVETRLQQREVNGQVTDELGNPLEGVTVVIKGTSKGTVTDVSGHFRLQANQGDILEFRIIGFMTENITVSESTSTLHVALLPEVLSLDEVTVSVGYWTQREADVTGAISSMSAEEITASGSGTLESALVGRMPGVIVSASDHAPGAGMDIRIRGISSLNASSAPLYVIDGFPVEGDFDKGRHLESTGQSPLTSIDPNDIESISVLKDASATAIYGARGANGVVIITTKSGKEGKTDISLNTQYGVQQMINPYESQNAYEYARYLHHRYFPFAKRMVAPDQDHDHYVWWDVEQYRDAPSTDWMKEITQLGITQNHNVSATGGSRNSNFLASVGHYRHRGIVKETQFNRYTGNLKASSKPTNYLSLTLNSNFSYSENNGTVTINSLGSAAGAGILQQALRASPLKTVDDPSQTIDDDDGVRGNPLGTLRDVNMFTKNLQIRTNASVSLFPARGLEVKVMGGVRHGKRDFNFFAPSTTSWGYTANGVARIRNQNTTSWLNENTITYDRSFDDHTLNLLGGVTVQSDHNEQGEMYATNFPIQSMGYHNIGVGESFSQPYSSGSKSLLLSYLWRANYAFKNRYLFTASFRADGSSKFAANNKWGYFPSLAVAWRLSDEPFVSDLGVFQQLKLRAGWGQTGNPNISPYQSLSNYGITKQPSGTTLNTAVFPLNTPNPDLKWEKTVQSNIGLDMAILRNRLTVTLDAYLKRTKDLLIQGDIPPSTGYNVYLYNSGEIENKGIELALNGVIANKQLKWEADLNFTLNRNKVVDLGDLATQSWMQVPGVDNQSTAILQIGSPIGLWYGYQTDGLWSQSEFTWDGTRYVLAPNGQDEEGNPTYPAAISGTKPGAWKFKDLSGPEGVPDGKIDAYDKTVIGISQPKYLGGLNNRFSFKNIDASVFLEWSYGKKIYNANHRYVIEQVSAYSNVLRKDYWLPIQYALDGNGVETDVVLDEGNPNARYPGPGSSDSFQEMHDGYMEDGSFLRIRTVSLGYTFNRDVLGGLRMKQVRCYVNIANLWTFTRYSGFDPDVNAKDLNGLRPGFDLSSYPLARTFMIGLSATF